MMPKTWSEASLIVIAVILVLIWLTGVDVL